MMKIIPTNSRKFNFSLSTIIPNNRLKTMTIEIIIACVKPSGYLANITALIALLPKVNAKPIVKNMNNNRALES